MAFNTGTGLWEPTTLPSPRQPGLSWTINESLFLPGDPAAASSRATHAIVSFDDTTAEDIVLSGVMWPDYAGVGLSVSEYWMASSGTTGFVQWGGSFQRLEADVTNIDTVPFFTQQVVNGNAPATAGIWAVTTRTFTQAEADGIQGGEAFRFRVRRVAGSDTTTGDAQLGYVSLGET